MPASRIMKIMDVKGFLQASSLIQKEIENEQDEGKCVSWGQ